MKKFIYSVIACVMMVSSLFAFELEVTTAFTGEKPSGTFYYPLTSNYDLVLGMGAKIPASKYRDGNGSELDIDLNLGLRTALPILGKTDLFFTFDNRDGVARTGVYEKSDTYTRSFSVRKVWAYHLAERVNLGVSVTLVDILLEGSKQVNILQNVSPILNTTINF